MGQDTFLGYETLAASGQSNHDNGDAGLFDLDTRAVSMLPDGRWTCVIVTNHDV